MNTTTDTEQRPRLIDQQIEYSAQARVTLAAVKLGLRISHDQLDSDISRQISVAYHLCQQYTHLLFEQTDITEVWLIPDDNEEQHLVELGNGYRPFQEIRTTERLALATGAATPATNPEIMDRGGMVAFNTPGTYRITSRWGRDAAWTDPNTDLTEAVTRIIAWLQATQGGERVNGAVMRSGASELLHKWRW